MNFQKSECFILEGLYIQGYFSKTLFLSMITSIKFPALIFMDVFRGKKVLLPSGLGPGTIFTLNGKIVRVDDEFITDFSGKFIKLKNILAFKT